MKQPNENSSLLDVVYEYEYLSEDLPIIAVDGKIEQSETCYMCSHFREDFIWIRIMKGTVEMKIEGSRIRIKEGDFLFLNSNRIRELVDVPDGPAECRLLIAKPDLISNPFIQQRLERMIHDSAFSSAIISPSNPLFFADMDAIFELLRHKPQEYEFAVLSHYLSQLRQILRIYRHTNPDDTISQNTDIVSLREMMAYIGEHFSEQLTLDQIAESGKVSRSKCTRLFRTYIQKSPIHHLHSFRLQKSVFLLNNTDLSISEIAYRCGFNQQSYYNRLFMRQFGMTPKEAREQHTRKGSPSTHSSQEE